MAITKEKKEEIVGEFRKNDSDTGSPEVQIAILTTRINNCLLYTSPSPRDGLLSRMPSSA